MQAGVAHKCDMCGKCCNPARIHISFDRMGMKSSHFDNAIEYLKVTGGDDAPEFPRGMIITTGKPCIHLTEDNLCDIYDNRPILCRNFECKKSS